MVYKKRNMQHPLIMEDNMPVHRSSHPWRKFVALLITTIFLVVILIVRGM